jgi:hypothetical protein
MWVNVFGIMIRKKLDFVNENGQKEIHYYLRVASIQLLRNSFLNFSGNPILQPT